ncbi:MAG: aspartate aminotransferase family protein [Rhizobiaceae bacterium]
MGGSITPEPFTRSRAHDDLIHTASTLIPGGTTTSAIPVPGLEFIIDRGEGAYVFDVDGRRFADFFMGSGPLVLGHANVRIRTAIERAASAGTTHQGLHRRTVELAARIVDLVPCAEQVRFCTSGTEATLHALRVARVHTGRRKILKFDGAYHGHHDLAVWSIGGDSNSLPSPTPESAGVQHGVAEDILVAPFNDTEFFRTIMDAYSEDVAAVICEPLQRAIPPAPGFLEVVREVCDRSGSVLIFDEIVTGFRLSPGGAQQRYGVTPDLATVGKAIAAGVPYAAILGKKQLMDHFDHRRARECLSFHCGTFSGYYLGAECAHETLDILVNEGGIDRLNELGELARDAARSCFRDLKKDVQVCGDGSLFEVYFTNQKVCNQADIRRSDQVYAKAFHRKLIEAGIYKSSVKAYLSLAHSQAEIDAYTDACKWAVKTLANR